MNALAKLYGCGAPEWLVWQDYGELGLTADDVDELIGVIQNPDFLQAYSETPEAWIAVHAWRNLGRLRAAKAVPALMALFDNAEEDEWLWEDLPKIFGLIGEPAVEPLAAYVADRSHNTHMRGVASCALMRVGTAVEPARARCVQALLGVLNGYGQEDAGLNMLVIYDLLDLGAMEAAPLVDAAFRAGLVDIEQQAEIDELRASFGLRDQHGEPA